MFTRELVHQGHSRRFVLSDEGNHGWEVRIEQDDCVVQQVRYMDWHRVERALSALDKEIEELERDGWQVVQPA